MISVCKFENDFKRPDAVSCMHDKSIVQSHLNEVLSQLLMLCQVFTCHTAVASVPPRLGQSRPPVYLLKSAWSNSIFSYEFHSHQVLGQILDVYQLPTAFAFFL